MSEIYFEYIIVSEQDVKLVLVQSLKNEALNIMHTNIFYSLFWLNIDIQNSKL